MDENREKLTDEARAMDDMLRELRKRVTFLFQKERRGFGHAVYQSRDFAGGDPVLLLLGDMVYRSNEEKSCMRQLIEAFENSGKTMVSIHPVKLDDVVHYGILAGCFEDAAKRLLTVEKMVEKPTDDYAEEYLAVAGPRGMKEYLAVFGQYILTEDVYAALDENIRTDKRSRGEIQLTDALDMVRERSGLMGYRINGRSYDLGLPGSYVDTVAEFADRVKLRYPSHQMFS